jgi:ABC-type polysaccharide/polyol phosphate export permease
MKFLNKKLAIETAHQPPAAAEECLLTFLDFERWTILASTDIRLRYRRTVLGPWWATLSTGAMIGSVGLVFGTIFGGDMSKYMPFFATGSIVWAFISTSLLEGCNIFTQPQAAGLIKSIPSPLVLHIYRMLARQTIVLAHNVTLIVFLWAIFRWPVGPGILLAIPGLALIAVALAGAALVFGILCARFRDIQQIVATLLQLLFLVTPIVWMPSALRAGGSHFLLYGNPLYHLIEVARGPLLGEPPPPVTWLIAIFAAAFSFVGGLALYSRFRHRVPYWL